MFLETVLEGMKFGRMLLSTIFFCGAYSLVVYSIYKLIYELSGSMKVQCIISVLFLIFSIIMITSEFKLVSVAPTNEGNWFPFVGIPLLVFCAALSCLFKEGNYFDGLKFTFIVSFVVGAIMWIIYLNIDSIWPTIVLLVISTIGLVLAWLFDSSH